MICFMPLCGVGKMKMLVVESWLGSFPSCEQDPFQTIKIAWFAKPVISVPPAPEVNIVHTVCMSYMLTGIKYNPLGTEERFLLFEV